MFLNFFTGCFSYSSPSQFENARLLATYSGDFNSPVEYDLQ